MDASAHYDRHGFALARGLLSPEILHRVASIAARVHALWMDEYGDEARRLDLFNSTGLTATRYFGPPFEHERAALFDALADDALWQLVVAIFGPDLYFHGTQMFFHPVAGHRQPCWHRDLQYMGWSEDEQRARFSELCHLHVRLPLRPERRFLLVPGSHRRWDTDLERDVRLEHRGHHSGEDLPSAQPLDLDPGDVLLFSGHMLHRGTYVRNEGRSSFDLMLARPHPRVPVPDDVDALPTGAELARIRNPGWYARARTLLLEH